MISYYDYYDKFNTVIDIDECFDDTHDCSENARCENVLGSYTCTCNLGFVGNGQTCKSEFFVGRKFLPVESRINFELSD